MVDKPIVFLDEATTGMDPINKRATIAAIREQARAGRTIFLTTHILEEAEALCDTIAIIDRGRLVASGDLPTIKSLVSNAFEVSITFESLTPALREAIQILPVLRFSASGNTVEATISADDLSVLERLIQIARREPVLHLEVSSATLEDVFVRLLGPERGDAIPGGRA
jgi:ABC-2 type transport system ATP-binding protein